MEKSEGMKQNMIAKLDRFLVRPNDRALFELPIRNVTQ
jgi:hypothetical protein